MILRKVAPMAVLLALGSTVFSVSPASAMETKDILVAEHFTTNASDLGPVPISPTVEFDIPIEYQVVDSGQLLYTLGVLTDYAEFAANAERYQLQEFGVGINSKGLLTLDKEVVSTLEQLQAVAERVNVELEWPAPLAMNEEIASTIGVIDILDKGLSQDEIFQRVIQLRSNPIRVADLSATEKDKLRESLSVLFELATQAEQDIVGKSLAELGIQETQAFEASIEQALREIYETSKGSLLLSNGYILDPYSTWIGVVDGGEIVEVNISGLSLMEVNSNWNNSSESFDILDYFE